MKPQVLLIQFRTNEVAAAQEAASIRRAFGNNAELIVMNALDPAILWSEPAAFLAPYDAFMMGGSGEYEFDGLRKTDDPQRLQTQRFATMLEPLFNYIFEQNFPTLALCFGHQLLGNYRGVRVWADPAQTKVGTQKVTLTEALAEHPLFAGIPQTFTVQYGHKDSLATVPEGARRTTSHPVCQCPSLQYTSNIFSFQYHPEISKADLIARLQVSPGYLKPGEAPESITKPSPHAAKILRNFPHFIQAIKTEDRHSTTTALSL